MFLFFSSRASKCPMAYVESSFRRRLSIPVADFFNALVTFNTMGDVTKQYYQTSDTVINMFSTSAVVVFVLTVIPIALLANNYGLRKSVRFPHLLSTHWMETKY